MTIRTCIPARALNEAFSHFEHCAEVAPEGTYEDAKVIRTAIGSVADNLIDVFRSLGLDLKINNSDGIREVEAVIYGWIKDANPDNTTFPVSEGFGEHVVGPAGERVMANTIRDRDALRRILSPHTVGSHEFEGGAFVADGGDFLKSAGSGDISQGGS